MYTYHSIIAFTSKYVVSSIFEALNNCQCRQRVGKLGVQTSAKKGSICHLPTIIGIRLMYLPNFRSTIVPKLGY